MDIKPLLYRVTQYERARFYKSRIKRQFNVFSLCLSPSLTLWQIAYYCTNASIGFGRKTLQI